MFISFWEQYGHRDARPSNRVEWKKERTHPYLSCRNGLRKGQEATRSKRKLLNSSDPYLINLGPARSERFRQIWRSMIFRCSTLQMNMYRQEFFLFFFFAFYPNEGLCKTIHTTIGILRGSRKALIPTEWNNYFLLRCCAAREGRTL